MDNHEIVSKLVFAALCTASNKEWLPTVIELSGDIQRRLAALEAIAAAARVLLRRAEGISPDDHLGSVLSLTEWVEWPGLRDALDMLDKE